MDIEEAKEQLLKHKKEIDEKYISARYSKAIEVVLSELDKKDKIINEMAEVLNDFDYDKQCEICHTYICSASVDGTGYMKCIIDYFTNKVEEDIKE